MKCFLRNLFGLTGNNGRRPAQRNRVHLQLDSLENRLVPTVVFQPVFGAETVSGPVVGGVTLPFDGLINPAVPLIFSGSSWTSANEQPSLDATQRILSGPYLSKLTQYGSDGQAHLQANWDELNTTVALTATATDGTIVPSQGDVQSFLQASIWNHPGNNPGIHPDTQYQPIYVVVSDPASSGAAGGQGWNSVGFYDPAGFLPLPPGAPALPLPAGVPINGDGLYGPGAPERMHMIWMGTNGSQDSFTGLLSHEVVEAMSNSTTVTGPALPPGVAGDQQICDNEPDGGRYNYRFNGIDLVQAYWSKDDNAYVVPDGNQQQLIVNPLWAQGNSLSSSNTFTGALNLGVQGDQLATDDVMRIDRTPNGGALVSLNPRLEADPTHPVQGRFQFDPGVVSTINIDTGAGNNLVEVDGVPAGVMLNVTSSGAGNDQVYIGGNATLASILGTVNVANSGGTTAVTIDASQDPANTIVINDHSVSFATGPTINYQGPTFSRDTNGIFSMVGGVSNLDIADGGTANVIEVDSVPLGTHVSVHGDYFDVVQGPAATSLDMQLVRDVPQMTLRNIQLDSTGLQPPQDALPRNLVAIANALTHSAESYAHFITDAYRRYLGRTPAASEVAAWVGLMQQGLSDERLEAGFIGSAEYIANHGGAGAGWVKGMYQDLLGRSPAQAEVDSWVRLMAGGMSADQVAYGFAASAEREGQRITADYQRYLGRAPSAGEVSSWVNAFLHGASNETVVAGFVGSPEYFQDPQQGNSSRLLWLDSAFQEILYRNASNAELAMWLGQMV
jgi:hypothetical protein